jgi:hypothetical protein
MLNLSKVFALKAQEGKAKKYCFLVFDLPLEADAQHRPSLFFFSLFPLLSKR